MPLDCDIPEIADEVAAGRALVALGNRLLDTGESDIEELEGHQAASGIRPRWGAVCGS
ncbi:dsRBD fold-containing protein [Catenulispora sp. MAP12-49]|uniref:dsRBD fold-containing protein n=1 Tax=Catenulispora sp. MAP12-49 TaxID=3156302 RepID=UPI0035118103